jgi:hypothetical protein
MKIGLGNLGTQNRLRFYALRLRCDQSKGVNSVSATAGCSLFWITVQGSVPTEACVIRSNVTPQLTRSMPGDAAVDEPFMMAPFLVREVTLKALCFQTGDQKAMTLPGT